MEKNKEKRDGDIIFQTSKSRQSKALQLATNSKYSHCGIIYKKGDNFFVNEAVRPVKSTSFKDWVNNGEERHFVIRRLKNADEILKPETLEKMKQVGEEFNGKDYDVHFKWTDDSLYCSELIWKIYKEATGLEIGKLQQLKDLNLDNEVVKDLMEERYGDNIPFDETVISPQSIFDSDLLITVEDTYEK